MNSILLEEKYALEYIKDMISSTKTRPVSVTNAKYHHNTEYRDASSICHHGILTLADLKKIGIKDYDDDLVSRMDDTESHINGTDAISLAVMDLQDLYKDEEEYNPYAPSKVDFLVSSEVQTRRVSIHYGNEFLCQSSISNDKLRSVDIRLLKLIEMIEKGYLSGNFTVRNAIEKYNYLKEIALTMKQVQLDIPIREMSNSDNFVLDVDKLSSNPKLVLK